MLLRFRLAAYVYCCHYLDVRIRLLSSFLIHCSLRDECDAPAHVRFSKRGKHCDTQYDLVRGAYIKRVSCVTCFDGYFAAWLAFKVMVGIRQTLLLGPLSWKAHVR